MKSKIFILLAVLLSFSGIQELKGQMDTVWSYPMVEHFNIDSWAFSPNDSLNAISISYDHSDTGRESYTILLNTLSGQKIKELRGEGYESHITSLFTPDNRYFISQLGTDKTGQVSILMWDVATGDTVRRLKIDSLENLNPYLKYKVSDMQFTPDKRYLFANVSLHLLNGDRAENHNHFVFWDTILYTVIN